MSQDVNKWSKRLETGFEMVINNLPLVLFGALLLYSFGLNYDRIAPFLSAARLYRHLFYFLPFLTCCRAGLIYGKGIKLYIGIPAGAVMTLLFRYLYNAVFDLGNQLNGNRLYFLIIVLFAIAFIQIPYKKVLMVYPITAFVYHSASIMMTFGGLSDHIVYLERGAVRSSFGTGGPNAASYILFISFLILYICYNKLDDRIVVVILLLVAGIVHYYMHTRTAVLIFFLFIGMILMKKAFLYIQNGKLRRIVFKYAKTAIILSYILISGFVYLLIYGHTKGWKISTFINGKIAGRFSIASNAYRVFGISAFGAPANTQTLNSMMGYHAIDISYMHILILNGIIACALIALFWSITEAKALRASQNRLSIFMLLILVYAVTEPVILYPPMFMVLPFCDFSEDVKLPGYQAVFRSKRTQLSYFIYSAAGIILFLAGAPFLFSRMRTVARYFQDNEDIPYLYAFVASLMSAFILIILYISIAHIFSRIIEKHVSINKYIVLAIICLFVISFHFMMGVRTLHNTEQTYGDGIERNREVMEIVISNGSKKIYSDVLPEIYISHFEDMKRTGWTGKDLAREKNVSIVMDGEYDGGDLFLKMGFYYLELPDGNGLFTNDQTAINALNVSGYYIADYYTRVRHVTPERQAFTLSKAQYVATYYLKLNNYDQDISDACSLRIGTPWKQGYIGERIVMTDDFNRDGMLVVEIPFSCSGKTYDVSFEMVPAEGADIEVQDITLRMTGR